jgi:hypothetical protein
MQVIIFHKEMLINDLLKLAGTSTRNVAFMPQEIKEPPDELLADEI